jgi:hypothetical protein
MRWYEAVRAVDDHGVCPSADSHTTRLFLDYLSTSFGSAALSTLTDFSEWVKDESGVSFTTVRDAARVSEILERQNRALATSSRLWPILSASNKERLQRLQGSKSVSSAGRCFYLQR